MTSPLCIYIEPIVPKVLVIFENPPWGDSCSRSGGDVTCPTMPNLFELANDGKDPTIKTVEHLGRLLEFDNVIQKSEDEKYSFNCFKDDVANRLEAMVPYFKNRRVICANRVCDAMQVKFGLSHEQIGWCQFKTLALPGTDIEFSAAWMYHTTGHRGITRLREGSIPKMKEFLQGAIAEWKQRVADITKAFFEDGVALPDDLTVSDEQRAGLDFVRTCHRAHISPSLRSPLPRDLSSLPNPAGQDDRPNVANTNAPSALFAA